MYLNFFSPQDDANRVVRPMDIEFTAFDSKALSNEDIPAALRQYKESLESL